MKLKSTNADCYLLHAEENVIGTGDFPKGFIDAREILCPPASRAA
jgi:hypothetical protein